MLYLIEYMYDLMVFLFKKNDPEQKEITLQALVVLGRKVDENKLSSIDIFLDPSPLIERIKMLS